MIISQSELLQKINGALVRLRRQESIDMETGGIIATLENTLNLVTVTALQLGLDEFPLSEAGCLELIKKDENDLTEDDLDELKYLAHSVQWALANVSIPHP